MELQGKPKNAAALLAAMTFDGIDGGGGMTANMLYCLLQNPRQLQEVRDNPALITDAWTEAARYAPPILGLMRCPIEDIEYEDVVFPAGVNVLMLNAAGNQDPEVTTQPSIFDIHRKEKRPLSFGLGGRMCVGRHLAKLQGEVVLQELLQRTEAIELLDHEANWGKPGLLRAIQYVPVCLRPT